jgi:hypothetical protein
MSQAEAGAKAKSLELKLICCTGVRNAALISKLLAKSLREELKIHKKSKL